MTQRKLEARKLEEPLLAIVGDNERGVLEAERLEEGCSPLAPPHFAGELRHAARHVDAVAHDRDGLGDFGFLRRRLARLASRPRRHRERAALKIMAIAEHVGRPVGSEQHDARLEEIDARRRDPPRPQGAEAELHGGARGERHDTACVLRQADARQAKLDGALGRELDNGVLDAELDAGHLVVEPTLDRLDEEGNRDRAIQQAQIQEPDSKQAQRHHDGRRHHRSATTTFEPGWRRALAARTGRHIGANRFGGGGSSGRLRAGRGAAGLTIRLAERAMHRRLPLTR